MGCSFHSFFHSFIRYLYGNGGDVDAGGGWNMHGLGLSWGGGGGFNFWVWHPVPFLSSFLFISMLFCVYVCVHQKHTYTTHTHTYIHTYIHTYKHHLQLQQKQKQ